MLAGGFAWQSEELLDYYYGVDAGEIPDSTTVHQVDAGISLFAKFSWQKKLSDKWTWINSLHYRKLDSDLLLSPLVEDDEVVTIFIGGSYHF